MTFFAAQLTQDILNKKDYFKYLGLIVQWISDVIAVVMISALLQPSPMLVEPLKCKHHCAYHNLTRQTSLSCFLQPQKLQLNRKSLTPCHTATEWSNQTIRLDLTTVQSSSKSQVKETEREKINTGIPSCPTSHLEEQDGAYQARIRTATARNWAKKKEGRSFKPSGLYLDLKVRRIMGPFRTMCRRGWELKSKTAGVTMATHPPEHLLYSTQFWTGQHTLTPWVPEEGQECSFGSPLYRRQTIITQAEMVMQDVASPQGMMGEAVQRPAVGKHGHLIWSHGMTWGVPFVLTSPAQPWQNLILKNGGGLFFHDSMSFIFSHGSLILSSVMDVGTERPIISETLSPRNSLTSLLSSHENSLLLP